MDDIARDNHRATMALLERHGIPATYPETPGGHTWDQLARLSGRVAPLLFR